MMFCEAADDRDRGKPATPLERAIGVVLRPA
jgi:hypothetical protein